MSKLNASERQAQIVELLSKNEKMKVMELADHFKVSRETIRRDMNALDKAGSLKKWFVGNEPVYDFKTQPVDTRITEALESKMKISKKLLEMIPEDTFLYLDTGSTTLCFARLLKERSGYTVITNSIPVINELIESSNELIITGGTINPRVMSAMGSQTISFLERIKVDVAILGSSGFDRHEGPSSNTFDDSQIKHVVVKNAQTNIVIADSRKATYSSLTQYASWNEIDHLITDEGISPEALQKLSEYTNVIIA